MGFGLALTCASPAVAAEPAATAERLFYEGRQALDRGDYARARLDFEQSLALAPRGSVLRNLANAEWALGLPVDALRHLRAALDRSDLPSDSRARARRDLETLYAATGHLAIQTDPGARVWIDGVLADGEAPWAAPLDVAPGARTVEARLRDRSGHLEVEAKPGTVVAVDVPLALSAASVPLAPNARQSATSMGIAPPASHSPAMTSGEVRSEGRSFWNARMIGGVVGAGAGLAALALGAFFFAQATGDEHAATSAARGLGPSACGGQEQPSGCFELRDALAAQKTDAAASRLLVGLGAASTVAGAAMILWPSPSPSAWAVRPVLGPTEARLDLEGRF